MGQATPTPEPSGDGAALPGAGVVEVALPPAPPEAVVVNQHTTAVPAAVTPMDSSSVPPWDAAETARLLADLRAAVAGASRSFPGGQFPPGLALAVADALAVAEHHVADHEAEARRGWDSLAALRRVRPWLIGEVIGRVTERRTTR
jgi:hypothetical protein